MSNKFSLDITNIEGIHEIEDQKAQNLAGGAFIFKTDVSPEAGIRVNGDRVNLDLSEATGFLGLTDDGPNANDPNGVDHQFVVTFFNGDRAVAFGNVEFGRGIFGNELERALEFGADNMLIEQREPSDEDQCSVVCLPRIF